MDCWEILGLELESADARSVKRAYAKLLKQHRPDEDPEGFARVHGAYQEALGELAWRDENDQWGNQEDLSASLGLSIQDQQDPRSSNDPLPFDIPQVEPVSDDPTVWKEVTGFDDTVSAADTSGTERAEKVEPPVSWEVVAQDLRLGQANRARHWLRAYELEDPERVKRDLANEILRSPEAYSSADTILFICRLTERLALRNPKLCAYLLDMVFPLLPPHMRESQVALASEIIELAALFKPLRGTHNLDFWATAFANQGVMDWESPVAIDERVKVMDLQNWDGHAILDAIVPDEYSVWPKTIRQSESDLAMPDGTYYPRSRSELIGGAGAYILRIYVLLYIATIIALGGFIYLFFLVVRFLGYF